MITLRQATMDDRDLLFQWRNDLNAERFTSVYPPPSEVTHAEHEAWLAKWIVQMYVKEQKDSAEKEGLYIAVAYSQVAMSLIGTGRITMNIRWRANSACLIHYMIAPEWRRKGFGTQLVHALVHKAKDEMGYQTIGAEIHRTNMASLKCALMGGVNAVGFL